MEKVDKNLNKYILETKVQMALKNGLIRFPDEVIFFGNTGAGKSTLGCILTNKDVKVVETKYKIVQLEYEGIKGGGVSETVIPAIMNDESNNVSYIDTPGFLDTKGPMQEIKNAFSTHDFLSGENQCLKAKILLVLKTATIEADRGENAQKLLERIDSMFPDLTDDDKKAFGIVFTCGSGKTPEECIGELCSYTENNPIANKWSCYFFDHPEQLFSLPKATKEMVGKTYTFSDKEKLMNFITKDKLINPKPNLTLSDDARRYLQIGFLDHIKTFLDETEKIAHIITGYYKKITDINRINKLYSNLTCIKNEAIKSPCALKSAIEKYLIQQESDFKMSFEDLENLNALHSFFVDTLKVENADIVEKIQNPIDSIMSKLLSEFNLYKGWIKEKKNKEEIEAKRKKEQKEAEEKRKRLEAEKKKLEEEKKRDQERRRQEDERRRREEEKRKQEEEEKRKFKQENNIYHKEVHDATKPKLSKGELFYMDEEEKHGICYFLGLNKIIIESNSVSSGSDPDNVLLSDDVYYLSQNKKESYISFNFMRRKVRLDYIYFTDYTRNYNCLVNYKFEGSNDGSNWTWLNSITNDVGSQSRKAVGHFVKCFQPYDEEYKCYFKYIRIIQTGKSYGGSSDYVFGIRQVEFFGEVSEPINI